MDVPSVTQNDGLPELEPETEPSDAPAPRSWSQAAHERRRALVIGAACFCVVTIGAAVAAKVGVPLLTGSGSPFAGSGGYGDLRTATIILDPNDESRCRRQTYDNVTGYLTSAPRACNEKGQTANEPVPPDGTIHRLDDISRSFTK
jgi:hypothetical protein